MMGQDPLAWRRSTRCGTGDCVEAAFVGDEVALRDSKDRRGPVLRFPTQSWAAFVQDVRAGLFDIPERL
jgi:Domain of unknown function (DUF397)